MERAGTGVHHVLVIPDGARQLIDNSPLELDEENWCEYFASLLGESDHLLASVALPQAKQGALGADLCQPLHGIRYDAEADEIEVAVDLGVGHGAALRYFVSAPRSIVVHEFADAKVVRVADASGVQTLIRLFDPSRAPEDVGPMRLSVVHT